MEYDLLKIRQDFPILTQKVNGHDFIYFDNAATTQKPQIVINSIVKAYTTCNANIHRGIYKMSRDATHNHEKSRERISLFIGSDKDELIFTRGTTESLNTIAYTYGESNIKEGDHIVVTLFDHHSNFLPWQQLAHRKRATFEVVPFNETGEIEIETFCKALKPNTKLVAFAHVSNVLGTVNPVKKMIEKVHEVGAIAVIDGAQAVAHMPVNVKDLDADFYAFSAHKMYGPTGIGALYGKRSLLESMPPFHFGGEMVEKVSIQKTKFNVLPYKFEAGTPDFVGSTAFAEAVNYIENIGFNNIRSHEQFLLQYATDLLKNIEGIELIGKANKKDPVISFIINGIHPYDLSLFLDEQGIAVRSGHHCAQPLLESLSLSSTIRVSFALYNTKDEIDTFVDTLKRSIAIFS